MVDRVLVFAFEGALVARMVDVAATYSRAAASHGCLELLASPREDGDGGFRAPAPPVPVTTAVWESVILRGVYKKGRHRKANSAGEAGDIN